MKRGLAPWPKGAAVVLGLAMMVGCKKNSPTAPDQPTSETVTLGFSSDIRGTAGSGAAIHASVNSAFRLDLDTSLPHDQTTRSYQGTGQLEWYAFSFDNPNPRFCANPTYSTVGSVFTVKIGMSSIFPGDPPSMNIEFTPGHPLENVTLVCGSASETFYNVVPGFWETSFRALHDLEIRGQVFSLVGLASRPSGSGFIAIKNYVRTVPASTGDLSEATTLTITIRK